MMNSATPMNRAQFAAYSAALLDKGQVAKLFGVEIRTIDRMMERGELMFVKLGAGRCARVRFRRVDVDRALDAWLDRGDTEEQRVG